MVGSIFRIQGEFTEMIDDIPQISAEAAVIFDLDGVLVDSYAAHLASWRRIYEDLGWRLSDKEFASSFGRTTREILQSRWPPDMPLDDSTLQELNVRKERLYREIAAEDFPVMPGAVPLLRSLHRQGIRLAVGSSAPVENVTLSLQHVDPDQLVDVAITGDDVTLGKPHPQVFQLAAGRLSVASQNCVVVEDAPAGIEAAHRAGMKCIGMLSRGRTPQALSAADWQVDHLSQITPELLHRLLCSDAPPTS